MIMLIVLLWIVGTIMLALIFRPYEMESSSCQAKSHEYDVQRRFLTLMPKGHAKKRCRGLQPIEKAYREL